MSPRVNPPDFDRTLRLEIDQYEPDVEEKSLIVLHHTVGGSAESTYKWWVDDTRPIATAYIVPRGDGPVYEVFPPQQWAWHLGIKSPKTERRSIGIELASEGGLTTEGEGDATVLYAFDGKHRLGLATTLLTKGRVIKLEHPWRGYQWFDAYDEKQIVKTIKLVAYLCEMYKVRPDLPPPEFLTAPADLRKWISWEGVLHHAMLRSDKSDLNPTFPWERLRHALS